MQVKTGELYIRPYGAEEWADVYSVFGVYLTRGSYASLIQWPAIKAVDITSWQEEDYSDPDLENLYLGSRALSLFFACRGAQIEAFWGYLAQSPKFEIKVAQIGLEFVLRVTSLGDPRLSEKIGLFTLNVMDDTPFYKYTYTQPHSTSLVVTNPFSFCCGAERKFSDYGVSILAGRVRPISAIGSVKPLLLVEKASAHGSSYDENPLDTIEDNKWKASSNDSGRVSLEDKQFALSCLLTAKTISEAMGNYYALLHDLITPNENEADITRRCALTLIGAEGAFKCYYTSQNVGAFFIGGNKVWIQFSIVFNCIGDAAPNAYLDTDLVGSYMEQIKELPNEGGWQHAENI